MVGDPGSPETWLWAVTAGSAVALVAVITACICGCRRTPKNDLLGVEGRVKITNPEEAANFKHDGSAPNMGDGHIAVDGKCTDNGPANKRASTANRSLPAIPVHNNETVVPVDGDEQWEPNGPSGDTSSELYATVGDNSSAAQETNRPSTRPIKKRPAPCIPSASCQNSAGKARSSPGSNRQSGDSTSQYSPIKIEHPYDRVKKSENPYAQLQADDEVETDTENCNLSQEYGERRGSLSILSLGIGMESSLNCSRWNTPHTLGRAWDVAVTKDESGSQPLLSRNEDVTSIHQSLSSGVSEDSPRPSSSLSSNPIPPPRSRGTRKSSSHNSLMSPTSVTALPGSIESNDDDSPTSVPDIPAATAIAGGISANQDLPYMTPPIPRDTPPPVFPNQQANFSGDSQDSNKGYTSISVREPLAEIKAQTRGATPRSRIHEITDPHYSTVSDDSDEMYAAIEDPTQVYTSGSETYAQIHPPGENFHHPPQPPSVDSLKHVAQAHSRQASSSSATSSVANLGSPKPEKRQANSPLPPPPPPASEASELYSVVDKSRKLSRGAEESTSKCVEEMYAKVNKKKSAGSLATSKQSESNAGAVGYSEPSAGNWTGDGAEVRRPMLQQPVMSPYPLLGDDNFQRHSVDMWLNKSEPMEEKFHDALGARPKRKQSTDSNEMKDSTSVSSSDHDVVVDEPFENFGSRKSRNTGYETVAGGVVSDNIKSDESDPGYEIVKHKSVSNSAVTSRIGSRLRSAQATDEECEPGYESVKREEASGYDPGYEVVKSMLQRNNTSLDSDPTYEELKPKKGVYGDSLPEPGYEVVKSENAAAVETDSDPNYEKVSNVQEAGFHSSAYQNYETVRSMRQTREEIVEPNYEVLADVNRTEGSMYEPNYETLHHNNDQDQDDPNYESVKYFGVSSSSPYSPPYERLHNEENKDSDNDTVPGYEKVKKQSAASCAGNRYVQPEPEGPEFTEIDLGHGDVAPVENNGGYLQQEDALHDSPCAMYAQVRKNKKASTDQSVSDNSHSGTV